VAQCRDQDIRLVFRSLLITQHRFWLGVGITTGIALLLLVGAFLGFLFFRGISDSSLAIVLLFGAAALIYLIAEELLVEAILHVPTVNQEKP
jgi:zinc transporter ZupT